MKSITLNGQMRVKEALENSSCVVLWVSELSDGRSKSSSFSSHRSQSHIPSFSTYYLLQSIHGGYHFEPISREIKNLRSIWAREQITMDMKTICLAFVLVTQLHVGSSLKVKRTYLKLPISHWLSDKSYVMLCRPYQWNGQYLRLSTANNDTSKTA